VVSATGSVPNGLTDFGFQVRVTRSASGLWSLFTSTLPQSTGTGDIASDLLTVSTTSIAQGTGTNNSITVFDNGYIAFAALHTSAAAARTGAEFDQLLVALGAPSSLPVTFGQIRASETNSGVRLYWENLTETDVVSYQVERSKDGTNFSEIARLLPVKNDGGQAGYQYTDGNPDQGNNYYRLRVTESNRKTTYSPVIRINTGKGKAALDLYPNPARNTILLEAEHLSPGIYQVSIRNSAGQLARKKQMHSTGSLVESIDIRDYPPGPYFLELTGALRMIKVFVVQ
jgi:Secretion system C-terminal sorting domain